MAGGDRAGYKPGGKRHRPSRAGKEILNQWRLAHDAHIAALIVEHGVGELWTADRDFPRFPGIRLRNPFNTQS
jgi:predicted nucleic acid-binding protein